MFTRSKKFISMLIVFVIVFTYMGGTLEVLASTDGLSAITNGFFTNGEMKFFAYFDENSENISNVNEKAVLKLELSPNDIGKGFLKEGIIKATGLDDSDINFKFSKIKNVIVDEPEVVENEIIEEEIENIVENEVSENVVENETVENEVSENAVENEAVENEEVENTVENEVVENEVSENAVENEAVENEVAENAVENKTTENNIENNAVISTEVMSRSSETREENEIVESSKEQTETFVNEEEIIQNETEEIQETYEELTATDFEIEIKNDNEIKVQNVIYNTKIEVEIEFTQKDTINIVDLYKKINLQLTGNYINIDLEKIETQANQEIIVGWNYSKEFDLSGEYTQFSPFKLGEHTGIIVESKVNVQRTTEDERYLPIKQTTIEIDVPDYNGNQPETVSVQSSKLMATRGEDLGDAKFDQNNWNYDAQNKKIYVTVVNENEGTAVNAIGEDEFVIVYKYNDYTEDEKVSMDMNIKVAVEEYSGKDNVLTTKELHNTQEIETKINDLITYNINSTEEKINKAKINANYNSAEAIYETEFKTTVNVNILTSDLLEELKINSFKENYIDANNTEFDASNDVYYNKVKFNYSEIKSMLQNGATIEIQNTAGELLYTLNDEVVQTEEDTEVKLGSKEKGVFVVFKNVSINGNIEIEFTKAIAKSSFAKSAFANFEKIKSTVSAELKYKNYEERYGMSEISTYKEFTNSKTVAEIHLNNNNLNTTTKNDGVEVRIALNNDKQDSDLYINPSFELVFPKYVKNVVAENMNIIYGSDLQIEDFEIYKQDDIVKMRIDLSGVQTKFSDSAITDGTNIIMNLNVELDEYTPRKQDQIKMYYCNEGVTNYESQTKWTIAKNIPNEILKQTNGFDVAIVNYQAPNGMVTANSIINYDGQASKLKSIEQGEKTAEIGTAKPTQIATMELVAMNNNDNKCTDVVFLGRTPFQGNKSVVSNKDLGTTATASMIAGIKESIQNVNMATIYYSTNGNATEDLANSKNGWVTEVSDWREVKSYMIVVKGEMAKGTVLRYTYDFEIPGNLDYEQAIYGNFGGFYNNNYETQISYESTEADKVGLTTEKEPEVKVTVEPYGGNENIYYGQILTLVATVENNSNEDIENATLVVDVPSGTVYTELKTLEETNGNGLYDNYIDQKEKRELKFPIDFVKAGESKKIEFNVRVTEFDKKQSELTGEAKIIGNTTYESSYRLTAQKGEMKVNAEIQGSSSFVLNNGSELIYTLEIIPNTEEKLENVKLSFDKSEYVLIKKINRFDSNMEKKELLHSAKDGKVVVNIGDIENETLVNINCKVEGLDIANTTIATMFTLYQDSTEKYDSNIVEIEAQQALLEIHQTCSAKNALTYYDEIEYKISINNNSQIEKSALIQDEFPYNVNIVEITKIVNDEETKINPKNKLNEHIELTANSSIQFICKGRIIDWENKNEEKTVSNIAKIVLNSGEEILSNEINTLILKNEKLEQNIFANNVSEKNQYSISGNIWLDSNGDNIQNEDEQETPSQVQVQLMKGETMVKATTTDSVGNYKFSELEQGDYNVVFNYDKDKYITTSSAEETESTKAVEVTEGTSVTDTISITNSSIENVNLGLQEKEKFDLAMSQYITKAVVELDGSEAEYAYKDLELAKVETNQNALNDATVNLEYKLVVENVGNVAGQVDSIVDYVPAGLTFSEKENENWSKGVNGNVYTDCLKNVEIAPGETQEITLVLSKKIGDENTEIVSNKAKIAYTSSSTRLTEAQGNNFASQETIVTSQDNGLFLNKKALGVFTLSMIGVVAIFGYMVQTGKIEISIKVKDGIKKVYK